METAGGIDNHDIGIVGLGRTQRIESDRRRVGTHLLLHDGNSHALAPNRNLLDGGGSEGIGRTEVDVEAVFLELVSQLSYRGGLPHSVHTHHHDDIGTGSPRGNDKIVFVARVVLGKQRNDFLA